jgi:undecaprenyl-diphosphatase
LNLLALPIDLIELLKAVVIGIVEGITEWLPISSTGHMILVDEFIKLDVSPAFLEMFLVVIQLGAIMAVICSFFRRLNPLARSKSYEARGRTWRLWGKVLLACIPAAIIGILLDDWAEQNFYNVTTVSIALVVYGVAFIVVERLKCLQPQAQRQAHIQVQSQAESQLRSHAQAESQLLRSQSQAESQLRSHAQAQSQPRPKHLREDHDLASGDILAKHLSAKHMSHKALAAKGMHVKVSPDEDMLAANMLAADMPAEVDKLSIAKALGIGLFQCLAIIPGTSRSGSTILGGRILGVSREAAAEFSFFLAIPVMFGWSLLKVLKMFVLDALVLSPSEWGIFIVGTVIAFFVSLLAIRFLMSFIKKHSFELFGWYRIVLGVCLLLFFALTQGGIY